MSSKVSVLFLKQPVPAVIKRSHKIAKSMLKNPNFPFPPVSAPGLQTAVDHLKDMHDKLKAGNPRSKTNLDEALADVDDYIMQLAEYVNHASSYDSEKLLTSGFEMLKEEKQAVHAEKEL